VQLYRNNRENLSKNGKEQGVFASAVLILAENLINKQSLMRRKSHFPVPDDNRRFNAQEQGD